MDQKNFTDHRLRELCGKVTKAAKDTLGDKLHKVILYGSYARGDYESDSDIDFKVLADVPQEEVCLWDSRIYEHLSGIDLDYDILVSVSVTNRDLFDGCINILPYYMNINNEGVVLYAA